MKYQLLVHLSSIFLFLVLSGDAAWAQNPQRLQTADSLFAAQRYTEALSVYSDLLDEGIFTPSQLLKTAYIEDASDHYERALYCLDLYYKKTGDRDVLSKIEQIAKENDLRGYQYDDQVYLIILLTTHRIELMSVLLALSILLLGYAYFKHKKGKRSLIALTLQLCLTASLYGIATVRLPSEAVITTEWTLLRQGPSAGAESIGRVGKGHKVKVLERNEVWTKIRWNESDAFVRRGRLQFI